VVSDMVSVVVRVSVTNRGLNVVTMISFFVLEDLHLLMVLVLEAELVLDVVAGKRENGDAGNLDAEVAPDAEFVIGEQGDWGGNHVGAEEGGSVHNEFVTVGVAVPADEGRADELEDVLDVEGDTENGEESPGDGSSVGSNTSTEEASVEVVKVPATEWGDSEHDNGGPETTGGSREEEVGEGTDDETGKEWDEQLHKECAEEGVGNTEAEVDEGGHLEGEWDSCFHLLFSNGSARGNGGITTSWAACGTTILSLKLKNSRLESLSNHFYLLINYKEIDSWQQIYWPVNSELIIIKRSLLLFY